MNKKMSDFHTELPWHGEGRYEIWGPGNADRSKNDRIMVSKVNKSGNRVGEACHDDFDDDPEISPGDLVSQANRDLIVKAVNSFHRMLNALNAVWDFIDDNGYLPGDKPYDNVGTIVFTKKEYDEIMKKIEDAVYLAAPEMFTEEYKNLKSGLTDKKTQNNDAK